MAWLITSFLERIKENGRQVGRGDGKGAYSRALYNILTRRKTFKAYCIGMPEYA